METKPLKNRKQIERNQKGQLQKGSILNPDGRPQGSKSFTTLMDEAVEEISKANNISKGEVWQILIKRGYSEAKDGNYPFYKDLLDRYFGKAQENVDVNLSGSLRIGELLDSLEDESK